MENNFNIFDLEKHDTKDVKSNKINGYLTVIWRNWDEKLPPPQMIYVTTVNPGEKKGPHLHSKRTTYLTCVEGEILVIIQDNDGQYHEIRSSDKEPKLLCVPKGIPSAHINISNKVSKVLVLADVAWRPNDNEMINIEFSDYAWNKWNLKDLS